MNHFRIALSPQFNHLLNNLSPWDFSTAVEKEFDLLKIEHYHIYTDPEISETDKYIITDLNQDAIKDILNNKGFKIEYFKEVNLNDRKDWNNIYHILKNVPNPSSDNK